MHNGPMQQTELAWAAGLFDGEGSTYSTNARYPLVRVCVTQNDREVLDRFIEALGVSRVYGPYLAESKKRFGSKPYFMVQIQKQEHVARALYLLWPFLGTLKRRQAINALKKAGHCAALPSLSAM